MGIQQKNVESCNIGNRGQEPREGRKKERKLKIRREGERIQEEVEVQGIRVICKCKEVGQKVMLPHRKFKLSSLISIIYYNYFS